MNAGFIVALVLLAALIGLVCGVALVMRDVEELTPDEIDLLELCRGKEFDR